MNRTAKDRLPSRHHEEHLGPVRTDAGLPRTALLIVLMVASLALFCVMVPLHVSLYGTPIVVALPLGAALVGAPLLSLVRPRTASVLACLAAWTLPLTSLHGSQDWPWPWSVPAMIAFTLFVLVLTLTHGWRAGAVPLAIGHLGPLLSAPLLGRSGSAVTDLIVAASVTAGAFLLAVLLDSRLRVGEELSREREVSAAEHSRRLLVEERTRIARELHDVIAHSTALTQVQASTAKYRLPDLSPEAAAEFDDIARSARSSLAEMRRLLGVLRTEDHSPPLAPQPGIATIPELVEGFRRAGAELEVHLDEIPADVPASVDLAAYRVTQEGLSNAVRHAPGAPIDLQVVFEPGAVMLRVHNERVPASPKAAAPGSGNGLRGMRERVSQLAGTLRHGPDPDGGWTVTAVLPLTDHPEEPA